jgi:hypothetical protein
VGRTAGAPTQALTDSSPPPLRCDPSGEATCSPGGHTILIRIAARPNQPGQPSRWPRQLHANRSSGRPTRQPSAGGPAGKAGGTAGKAGGTAGKAGGPAGRPTDRQGDRRTGRETAGPEGRPADRKAGRRAEAQRGRSRARDLTATVDSRNGRRPGPLRGNAPRKRCTGRRRPPPDQARPSQCGRAIIATWSCTYNMTEHHGHVSCRS